MERLTGDKNWVMQNVDCISHAMVDMPAASVDFAVYSPPFPAMFAFTDSEADLGNIDDLNRESFMHFKFFFHAMRRVMKPGRVMVVHCCQIPRMKRCGGVGLHDFRGMLIRLGERAGFIYEYDWMVRKNPQALKHGTGVLTPTGYRPIESLRVGDEVIGSNGKATTVKGVYPHGQRQMYRVTFIDGRSIECDAQHLWQVTDAADGKSKQMTTADITASPLHHDTQLRFSVPTLTAPAEFADSAGPADRYDALQAAIQQGASAGPTDRPAGWAATYAVIAESEQEASRVRELIESLMGLARVKRLDGEAQWGVQIMLLPLGMTPRAERFINRLPSGQFAISPPARYIVSIEPTEMADCTCIEVEAEDHLYVIDGCIVTHNSQAIRTRSRELQFAGLEKDRAKTRGTLNDYLIKFVAPGVNEVPIADPDDILLFDEVTGEPLLDDDGKQVVDASGRTVTRDNWIAWAEGCWMDIRETDTLRVKGTKAEDDTRHICPLQLETIRRLTKLYSNPGEIVFSPFAGIGSEGYVALELGRKFYGCELKREYYLTACRNLREKEETIAAEKLAAAEFFGEEAEPVGAVAKSGVEDPVDDLVADFFS